MKAQGEYTSENFELHDAKNPHIWKAFVRYSLQVAAKRKYFSAKAIFHRMRWDTAIGEADGEYKLSDGWISHYARKFMDEYPEYKGFFRTVRRRVTYFESQNEWDM